MSHQQVMSGLIDDFFLARSFVVVTLRIELAIEFIKSGGVLGFRHAANNNQRHETNQQRDAEVRRVPFQQHAKIAVGEIEEQDA